MRRRLGIVALVLAAGTARSQDARFETLLEQLGSGDASARARAAAELDKSTEKVSTLAPGPSDRAAPVLLEAIVDPDLGVRLHALAVLLKLDIQSFRSALRADRAVQRLAQAMAVPVELEKDPRTEAIRLDATVALGACGEDGVPLLIEVLRADSAKLRKAAAQTLGRLGPQARAASMALADAVSDPNPGVSRAAQRALEAIGQ
jgi:HEAT repeat protein